MVHHSAESQPHFVSFLLNRPLRDSGQVDKSWWLFLHHKPLVLGDLTSDMGTTGSPHVFQLFAWSRRVGFVR